MVVVGVKVLRIVGVGVLSVGVEDFVLVVVLIGDVIGLVVGVLVGVDVDALIGVVVGAKIEKRFSFFR